MKLQLRCCFRSGPGASQHQPQPKPSVLLVNLTDRPLFAADRPLPLGQVQAGFVDRTIQENKTTVERRVEQFLEDLEHSSGGDHGVMRCVFPDATALGRIGGDGVAVLYDRPITAAQAQTLGDRLVEQLGAIQ